MGGALPLLRARAQADHDYGDGFQVRDVLHVSDLVDAMEAVWGRPERCAGEIYNLGGGPERVVSIVDAGIDSRGDRSDAGVRAVAG